MDELGSGYCCCCRDKEGGEGCKVGIGMEMGECEVD